MAEDQFAWQRLAAQIRQRIADGTYEVGALIPTVRQLMGSEGRSDNTITRALAELADEGLLQGEVGVGTRVIAKPGAVPRTAAEEIADLRNQLADHEERLRALENPEA